MASVVSVGLAGVEMSGVAMAEERLQSFLCCFQAALWHTLEQYHAPLQREQRLSDRPSAGSWSHVSHVKEGRWLVTLIGLRKAVVSILMLVSCCLT